MTLMAPWLTSYSVRVTNSARLPCFHGGTAAHTWNTNMTFTLLNTTQFNSLRLDSGGLIGH